MMNQLLTYLVFKGLITLISLPGGNGYLYTEFFGVIIKIEKTR